MKKILGATILLSLLVGVVKAQTQSLYDINVIDARKFKEPARNWKNPNDVATYYADISRHKHHEVNVYHYAAYYQVNYFQSERESIKPHGFNITEPEQFDKAEYRWVNDTLNISLINTSGKTKIYKGFGSGRTNSMRIDN